MQGRTAILCAFACLLAGPALAQPSAEAPAAPPAAAAAKPAAAAAEPAVDANGVPAWAKRKRLHPVQACETKPNIGIETWRARYDAAAPERLKPRPATATCH
jgi:hypothetical protein